MFSAEPCGTATVVAFGLFSLVVLTPMTVGLVKDISEYSKVENEKTAENPEFTTEDLMIIEQDINGFYVNENGKLFIKLTNGEYIETYSNYNLYSKDGETLELTDNTNLVNVEYLGNLRDYIIENEIEPSEYKMVDIPNVDGDYILNKYGEDVYHSLEEDGYPILCFDVADLYKVYEEQKDDNFRLELK